MSRHLVIETQEAVVLEDMLLVLLALRTLADAFASS